MKAIAKKIGIVLLIVGIGVLGYLFFFKEKPSPIMLQTYEELAKLKVAKNH